MSAPTATVIIRIRRRDLVAAGACGEGLAVFDAIAAMQGRAGVVRWRATLLHQLWLAKAYPSFCRWLIENGMIPPVFAPEYADLRRADLTGANLYRANLEGADLSGADFYEADLYDANLSCANLDGANLRGASIYSANLSGADLCGANLRSANIYSADLSGADLCGADLTGANLYRANLEGADLSGANLRGARWPRSLTLPNGWTCLRGAGGRDYVILRRAT